MGEPVRRDRRNSETILRSPSKVEILEKNDTETNPGRKDCGYRREQGSSETNFRGRTGLEGTGTGRPNPVYERVATR